ncbi:MAG TPA: tail protein X [Fusobacterium sp.]|uniref:tail protein X n=1 Tax=Fusobacterium sp. TaxID=68766 RepID=UPI002F3F48DD
MKTVKVYRTEQGDTWDYIAYKIYGDEMMFHQLMRANVNLIHIAIFDSNIPIIIPENVVRKKSEDGKNKLPPWRR